MKQTVAEFFAGLPAFSDFGRVADPAVFSPAPDHALVAISDVVASTAAIAEGRYKAVNFAGAAMISALANALGGLHFPFVFGGDGAVALVDGSDHDRVTRVLAETAAFARDELALEMRVALVAVEEIRAGGSDVRVARHALSGDVATAMFAGGGIAFADKAMKTGAYAIAAAEAGSRPDLEGLSCRWNPVAARNGTMLSLIVVPAPHAGPHGATRFTDVVARVLDLVARDGADRNPVPPEGPGFSWPGRGLDLEARAMGGGAKLAASLRRLKRIVAIAWLLDRTGLRFGGFSMRHYRRVLARNTDYRKFDDGLRMTLDCSAALAARLERLLEDAEAEGVVVAGLHAQDEAMMTCIVPSFMTDDHIHFLDGAGGGYAMAARNLKAKLAAAGRAGTVAADNGAAG
ncbi:MAG: DUF3095 family protein [Rhizobiales bacterium]|nr:DUF3095 family protein [Hyphomicrobiales bacterium]